MGRIVGAHGVGGRLKVAPETDDPARFALLDTLFVGADEVNATAYAVEEASVVPSRYGETVMLTLKGISDRTAATSLRGLKLYAAEADLPPLGPDEYYLSDLIGLKAVSPDGDALGDVRDVLEMPGQNIILLSDPDGREVMVPAVEEFLKAIDFEKRTLCLTLIEGMN